MRTEMLMRLLHQHLHFERQTRYTRPDTNLASTLHVAIRQHRRVQLDIAKWAFERMILTAEMKPWDKKGIPHLGGAEFLTKLVGEAETLEEAPSSN